MSEFYFLNRAECNIMRGFAILAVASNNFTHLINGVVQDNEFIYDYSQVDVFVSYLKHPTSTFLLDLLAFYSPFGVMLFIFLSGYGLTLKYEIGKGNEVSHGEFVSSHYWKLFQMQLKGLALFLLVMFVFDSNYIVYFRHLMGQLFMLENLNPIDPVILAGPYWFFGMIMEMYIIYRYVIYRRSTSFLLFVIALSILLMAPFQPDGQTIHYLRINFCMAVLPFGLGVLAARYGNKLQNVYGSLTKCVLAMFVFFVLLTLCKFNFYAWLVMPIFIIGISIPLAKILNKMNMTSKVFCWVGSLSGIIFVVHPIVREILIQRTNTSGSYYGMFLVYLFMTISLSIILKPLFEKKK